MTDFERQMQVLGERMAESQTNWERRMDELNRSIDKVTKQIGGIDNNIGHHAEEYFQNIFTERMVFGGVEYDDMTPNLAHREKNGEVEFDIFLENGDAVAIIEVKNRIHPNFIKELAGERLQKFRKYFPGYNNHKAYLGIAGFSFSKAVLKEAKEYGVGIIRQVGDSVEMAAGELKAY
jgi:hypothetical protein